MASSVARGSDHEAIVLQAMAIMELKTALAVLCAQFHFRPAAGMGGMQGLQALETMALTLHVHGGIHIHCQPHQADPLQLTDSV
jgi:hypothetical protein